MPAKNKPKQPSKPRGQVISLVEHESLMAVSTMIRRRTIASQPRSARREHLKKMLSYVNKFLELHSKQLDAKIAKIEKRGQ